jgi:uncharacterized membrane protein
MSQLTFFLKTHWFALTLILSALGPGAVGLWRLLRRRQVSFPWLVPAAALLLLGAGGLFLGPDLGMWVAAAASAVLFLMFVTLLLSGHWWAPLAGAVAAVLAVGLGALSARTIGDALAEVGKTLLSLEPAKPWWLLLLLLVPCIFWFSYKSLAGLGPVRRWVAIGLRSALIIFLALALAEVRLKHENETVTILFLVDRSYSVPQEPYEDPATKGKFLDHRWDRIKTYINEAVEKRGPGHERDRAGLIVFGRRPRLELPPSDAPRFQLAEIASTIDGNYTDIAAAIKLALASFPEGSGKRIILLSDGNENLGNAEEQARLARLNGVQIDVVPLAAGQRNENEVLVQSIEAPPIAEQGTQLPIRVLVRSHNPNPVVGTLKVSQLGDPATGGQTSIIEQRKVTVRTGLTTFTFKQPLSTRQQSYTYEGEFVPEGVVVNERELQAITGDRVQNNRATTHVVAPGKRRILLVEAKEGEHRYLERELRSRNMDILSVAVDILPKDKDKLGVFLSNFDCLILANLPADTLTEDQQEMIRSNTHEQGCGLVMIGGPDSYGAGGWQNTPVEKALPVDSEIKALKVQGKGGLVLIMHACEMADGNFWEKKIAKLAIEKLSNVDEVGIIGFDWGGHKWHIPLQEIADKRNWLLGQVDKINPGDMPDFDTPLQMAFKDLTDPKRELATKHVIVISDGDPQLTNQNLLAQMRKEKVTVSTVGVATHGAPMAQNLANIANQTRGRFYNVTSASMLPQIYLKETRLVSQSFVYEKRFPPNVVFRAGPTERLPDPPALHGFVRTTPKSSPLVEVAIETPAFAEQKFPILAYWHYGLGRSVAFTSDARTGPGRKFWDREWAESEMYIKFWEQVIDWSMRAAESKNLAIATEFRDGKVKVIVDARDDQNRPDVKLNLRGGVTTPTGKGAAGNLIDLKFEQKNAGIYEAEFRADEAGSYFLNVQAVRSARRTMPNGKEQVVAEVVDGIRSGVTIPYSPEYSDLESNTALLEKLRQITEGQAYEDDAVKLSEAARDGEVFRPGLPTYKTLQPIWYWLLFLAAAGLFFDVAVRRIAVDLRPALVTVAATWDRLRGRTPAAVKLPEYFDRLRSRKAQVGEALKQPTASRRFEADETAPAVAAPPGADALPDRPEAAPRRTERPRAPGDEADYLSRLKKAKKRAMEGRENE